MTKDKKPKGGKWSFDVQNRKPFPKDFKQNYIPKSQTDKYITEAKKYVDNLYVVYRVIEFEVADLLEGRKTFEEFLLDFAEKDDVEHTRKEAREILGVEPDVIDMGMIDKRFKNLAKLHQPDMDGGDTEMFKRINNAHKVLKRELR